MCEQEDPKGRTIDSEVHAADIERQLQRILSHHAFRNSRRLSRFLSLVTDCALAGHAPLKEYVIGLRVFDRNESYDPQTDPVVRVMAGRLRAKLAEYYVQNPGEPVVLEMPSGGYGIRWRRGRPHTQGLSGPATSPIRRVTVGRHAEKASLQRTFSDVVRTRTASTVLVTGEPGVGKTTVCAQFIADLRSTDDPVWVGRGNCTERSSGTDPFAPVLEMLDSLRCWPGGERAGAVLSRAAPLWSAYLSRDLNALTPSQMRTASAERMRRELCHLIEDLSAGAPVLLFIDDLRWADASTCELLRALRVRLSDLPVLLIACSRNQPVSASSEPFLALEGDFRAKGLFSEIELAPLPPADTAELVHSWFEGNQFPADFTAMIQNRTRGHPLFITDMLRYLEQSGVVAKDRASTG
jgi:hypothetical protein